MSKRSNQTAAPRRSSGVLLHITSLPSAFGIGDLGPAADQWIDWLAAAQQTWWQILPLGPPGHGNSPYQCFSAFAGNPLFISPEELVRDGLLQKADVPSAPRSDPSRVAYGRVHEFKARLLRLAWERYRGGAAPGLRRAVEVFEHSNRGWLNDYALFMALREQHHARSWQTWPRELIVRERAAMRRAALALKDPIAREKFIQFLFFRQLDRLRRHASENGVMLLGDLPIYVSLESSDVWANQELFLLDRSGRPTAVAGVPPDAFAATGQRWGNPLFNWRRMREDGFAWWVARVKSGMQQADLLRIDHFRGFESYWKIPAAEPTAVRGRWIKAPGEELFRAMERELGGLPFVAEDLGLITPEVHALRDSLKLPGMRVLQFAFGDSSTNIHLPHNHIIDCVAYTGTHDNDTTAGWFKGLDEQTRRSVEAYIPGVRRDPAWSLLRAAWSSVARCTIAPAQDLLKLGSRARMNFPGRPDNNWQWRMDPRALTPQIAEQLAQLTTIYGRRTTA